MARHQRLGLVFEALPDDRIGYNSMQFFIHFPVVMLLAAALMHSFTYRAPVMP